MKKRQIDPHKNRFRVRRRTCQKGNTTDYKLLKDIQFYQYLNCATQNDKLLLNLLKQDIAKMDNHHIIAYRIQNLVPNFYIIQ